MVLFPLATHLFDQQLLATSVSINPALPPLFWIVVSIHTKDYVPGLKIIICIHTL